MATLIGGTVATADQRYRRPAANGIAKGSCKSSSTGADIMTFILAIERKHRVLRAKATGIIASQDLVDLDNASIAILSRDEAVEGAPYRGLYDFSELAAMAVPQTTAAARGSRKAIVRGQRVMVQSRAVSCNAMEAFVQSQKLAGDNLLVVVDSVDEAYDLLDLDSPNFEVVGWPT